MRVEIWSDVVCPWCYVGKRRFERALEQFPHRVDVEVVWRSFELDEAAPRERTVDHVTHLATKYRVPKAEAQQMVDRMVEVGRAEGLDLRFDIARSGNTFDAHRLLHLAGDRGVQPALADRLFHAAFTEGAAVGDHETLVRLGGEVGLDPAEVRATLTSDAYADAVRADEQQARAYRATGVPFFVVDNRYGVSGAQPTELFTDLLERAWADSAPLTVVGTDSDACADGSCSV